MENVKEKVEEARKGIDFTKNEYQLKLNTNLGAINLNFYPDVAPNHCANMIALAKVGFYDGLSVHRVVKGFVIQGGCPTGNGTGGPGYRVNAEFNNRKHEFGVLSMARSQDPNSAGSQFFICLDTVPYLDGQYTAFGKIADDQESAATLRTIGSVETGRGDVPLERVTIVSAEVSERSL